MRVFRFFGIFLLLFSTLSSSAVAQEYIQSLEPRDISFRLSPEVPGSNEKVTASPSSLLVDLNRLIITWFVDGEVQLSGIGERTLEFTTKNQGETTLLEVYIQVNNTNVVRRWMRIAPADLDMLWQADTYTPPFYRGKALPTPESFIRIIGLPNIRSSGNAQQETQMVFNWRQNRVNQPEQSGFGRNPFIFRNDFLTIEEVVELEVVHPDGRTRASAQVSIPITDTEVFLYTDENYLRKAQDATLSPNASEVTIIGAPFYYSVRPEVINSIQFEWYMNGAIINTPTDDPSRPRNLLRTSIPTERITADVGLRVDHPAKIMQTNPVKNITIRN